ncbi:AraC family transcriptional regulator [Paenibacillus eucommiae]|uniref:AraC-like DNA-binding protein n=1 Tax=Paenibacillus eucommiae TaxID=1355755 RepID=A0ABS4J5V7_9BACL|nr:AraC family transcriptional regulator [Paenibacillus eucommiae]MBP1994511.1 AraC-like DNA-binding protein [Paenibacillus eucommiae]
MTNPNPKVIPMNDIHPHVRFINLFKFYSGQTYGPRMIYDHQFLYIFDGTGVIDINGVSYRAVPGDLFFYGPQVVHRISADHEHPFTLSGIHFDFVSGYEYMKFPIGPLDLAYFDSSLMKSQSVAFADFEGFPPHINVLSEPRVGQYLREISDEFRNGLLFNQAYMNGLFTAWLMIVARLPKIQKASMHFKKNLVHEILDYIQLHYKEPITYEILGSSFHFHPIYLNKLIQAYTGTSLHQHVIRLRIQESIELLLTTNMTIKEIASQTGYDNVAYFSRIFKKKTGYTPLQMRGGI